MWDDLKKHAARMAQQDIVKLFDDPKRAKAFSVLFDGMLFDYSKTRLDTSARDALLSLLESRNVPARREAMFRGDKINETENRAVLHTALRNLSGDPVVVDGHDVMPGVRDTLERMSAFAENIRTGAIQGSGGSITDVVNIGIGGSHLGPEMAALALLPYADGPKCHFVSNVDGADIADTLAGLNPSRTLVIIASKTFTTIETMTNARTARDWMAKSVDDPGAQFVALSSATDKTAKFGISPDRVFGFENWVGGRYSVWGPIGLSLVMSIGRDRFLQFLQGAEAMDQHFRTALPDQNIPIMLALVGMWHAQVCGYTTRAVLPYDQRLSRLAAYFQQLEMESNGKGVTMDGIPVDGQSGPVVWGEPGTNGQHAFYQLIHQGTQVVPCEFLVAATGHEPDMGHHHSLLVANCLAQSEALMRGRSLDAACALMVKKGFTGDELDRQARHRVFPGNRPSTTLIYDQLTPRRLGQILALYEHRVFVEGVILGINSFDQWGVELGKELAVALQPILDGQSGADGKDASTRQLIEYVQSIRG